MITHILRRAAALVALCVTLVLPVAATAHPVPFSYIDLHLYRTHVEGTLTLHVVDAAHELRMAEPDALLEPRMLAAQAAALEALLGDRLGVESIGPVRWTEAVPIPAQDALALRFRIDRQPPGALALKPRLFGYDRFHETFVNVYENGTLRQQLAFGAGGPAQTYYRGSATGALAVMRSFVPAGIHHIWIGADHLLFLFGLVLIGGTWRRLAMIVTAFTVGHSITLSLAVLDIVNLPARIVEPAIALSIVAVGVDNLLRLDRPARDWRAIAAAVFGLIHGFGFATVLKELGLPPAAFGWGLFSFNLGVELGQLVVVLAIGTALAVVRRRSRPAMLGIQTGGSIAVLAGGAFWFVQRAFF